MERTVRSGSALVAWFASGAIVGMSLTAAAFAWGEEWASPAFPIVATGASPIVASGGSSGLRVHPLPPAEVETRATPSPNGSPAVVGTVRPALLPTAMEQEPLRSERLELAAQEADRLTREAYDLAGRGALFAAREQFLAALRVIAEALDMDFPERQHAASLNAAWLALREAEDFLPRSATATPPDTAQIVVGHKTPILKEADVSRMTSLEAFRRYLSFAQDQFAHAAGAEVTASMALRGLGKVYGAFVESGGVSPREPGSVAVMFYQAALSAWPGNYMAANDLGVVLAKGGRWQDARRVLEYAVSVSANPSTCWNLLRVCTTLNDAVGTEQARRLLLSVYRPDAMPDDRRPEIRWIDAENWVDHQPLDPTPFAAVKSAPLTSSQSPVGTGAGTLASRGQAGDDAGARDNLGDRFLDWLGLKPRSPLASGTDSEWIFRRPASAIPGSTSAGDDAGRPDGAAESEDLAVRRTAWFESPDGGLAFPRQDSSTAGVGPRRQTVDPTTGMAPGASLPPPPSTCDGYRCGVACPNCGGLRRGGWNRARIIAWERYAQGEYVGAARAAHVNHYRLRVDDELQIVYRLTHEETTRPYRLNVGDEIRVESAVDPKIERTVIVQPDGTVTLLLLGQVKATGQTVDQLRQKLDQLYSKYYRKPSITVTPMLVNSKLEDLRASVDRRAGEGGQSQDVRVTPEGTISLPLLATVPAQGLTLRELELELNARYHEQLEGMEVTPVLVQRAARYVYVLGEVASPGRFELTGPTTVLQAISMAGGWNIGANLRQIVVFRRGEDWRLNATMLNLESTLHGHNACPADEIWLSDSDVVLLPKNFFQRADDVIEMVFTRGIYGVFPMRASINFAKLSTI